MADFSNKVVLITGANGNLGTAVTHAFARAGANLVLTDHGSSRLQNSFPELAAHSHLYLDKIDVTDPASVASMCDQAVSRFGRIDILVNTVGGFKAGPPVHETAVETWHQMFNLNATSVFLVSQAVIPVMIKQGSGRIINISARPGQKGGAGNAAYSAAKSAVLRLTESMSAELKKKGINVNVILPGTIDTPQNRNAMPNADTSRWVTPESIAAVIVFLASPDADDIHAAAVPVTGKS